MSDWQERALCAGDLQFTERPEWETRPTCAACPVRAECLELGIAGCTSREASCTVPYGGVSAGELARLSAERRREQLVVVRVCRSCRQQFAAETGNFRYCSDACRAEGRRQTQQRWAARVAS